MKKITALLLSLILAVSMSAAFADELMDFTYAANVYAFTDDGLAQFTARNGLCGFVNTKGEVAIPAQFETASSFSEGLALVSRNGLYGFINTQGELVIDYQWTYAGSFSEGRARVKDKDNVYGYIDTNGLYINKASETVAAPSDTVQEIFTIKKTEDGSKGIYELFANGRGIATTTIYNDYYVEGYSYDIIYPVENAESLWVICQRAKGYSDSDVTISRILYDAVADKILMEDMEDIETTLSSGLIAVKDDALAYYVNEQGVMAIPPIGTETYTFVDGIARVDIGDTCVFINPEGQIISDVYDKAYSMKNGFTIVQQNGQWFVINDQFQCVR